MIRPFGLATAFTLAVSAMPLTIIGMLKSDSEVAGFVFLIEIGIIWLNAYVGLGGTFEEIGRAFSKRPSIEGE